MQASWEVGVGKGEVRTFRGIFYVTDEVVEGGWVH